MFDRIRSLFGKRVAPSDPRALFRAEFEGVARSLPDVGDVSAVENAFALDVTTTAGETHRVFLDNHFVETREMSPDQRRARIVYALSWIGQPHELSWDEAREHVLPVIRGATFGTLPPSAMLSPADVGKDAPIRRTFAPFVDVRAVVDRPTNMMYVMHGTAKKWGVSADEVFETALATFAARASLDARLYDDVNGPLFVVDTNDSYESSRLLVPGWLASFRGRVEGEPIAIVPQREMLLVGGSARPAMIARLLGIADREFASSPRKISPALYTVDAEDRVVPYLSDDPAVRIAHEKLAMFEHDQQKAVLEEQAEDVFVASYQVFQSEDGTVRSMATWTRGVDTLLPKTETVALVVLNDDETAIARAETVPWDAIADRLTPVPGMHPPRYRTTGEHPG